MAAMASSTSPRLTIALVVAAFFMLPSSLATTAGDPLAGNTPNMIRFDSVTIGQVVADGRTQSGACEVSPVSDVTRITREEKLQARAAVGGPAMVSKTLTLEVNDACQLRVTEKRVEIVPLELGDMVRMDCVTEAEDLLLSYDCIGIAVPPPEILEANAEWTTEGLSGSRKSLDCCRGWLTYVRARQTWAYDGEEAVFNSGDFVCDGNEAHTFYVTACEFEHFEPSGFPGYDAVGRFGHSWDPHSMRPGIWGEPDGDSYCHGSGGPGWPSRGTTSECQAWLID